MLLIYYNRKERKMNHISKRICVLLLASLFLCACAGNSTDTDKVSDDAAVSTAGQQDPEDTPKTDPVTGASDFSSLEGKGTADSPYLISNAADLRTVSEAVFNYADTRGVFFLQNKDIDLSGHKSWMPIGTIGIPFEGTFDGNGHKIEGMSIDTSESFAGLFGFVTGCVKNIEVHGQIKVSLSAAYSHSYAGGISGGANNGALIKNCKSYVNIEGDSYLGGIVGGMLYTDDYMLGLDVYPVIEECENHGNIHSSGKAAKNEQAMYFGGITGYSHGAVRSCTNYGSVKVDSSGRYIGGIAGYTFRNIKTAEPDASLIAQMAISDCKNLGDISGYREVGGITGQNSLPIVRCENKGSVTGTRCIGGIVGVHGTSGTKDFGHNYISECKNEGKITLSEQYAGGIAGYSYLSISDSKNSGEVIGTGTATRVGGIAGYAVYDITGCDNSGVISAHQGIGGILGWSEKSSSTVSNCKNLGRVTSNTKNAESYHIGGIVGMLGSTNAVRDCENSGEIIGGGNSYNAGTGGIAGSLYSSSVIDTCKNTGRVFAPVRAGGIAGFGKMNASSYIKNCENTGEVASSLTSSKYIGGILGYATSGNITDCKNSGKISVGASASNCGSIVGYAPTTTQSNCTAAEVSS